MNKYKKLASLTATVAVMGMTSSAFAESPGVNSGPNVSINLIDTQIGINQDGDVNAQAYAGLELQMSEQAKINLAIDLERIHGALIDDEDFNWEAAVAQAEITIDLNNSGIPIVIVAGKLFEEALVHTLSNIPNADESGLMPNVIKQVIGLRIAISTPYLDELVVAATEVEGGDMEFNSATIRLTAKAKKALSASITAVGTLAYEMNDISDDGYAASAGLVFDVSEMTGFQGLEVYGQATQFDNFAGIDTEFGWEVGANYSYNDQTSANISYKDFNDEDRLSVGMSYMLKEGWTASGELYVMNIGEDNESRGAEALLTIPTTQLFKR